MDFFHFVLLGFIQGASEFLPISSSAHLVVVPWLFDFPDPGLAFDVALHFGTLAAVVLYFWRDWVEIFKLAFKNFQFSIFNFQSISDDFIFNSKKNTKYKILNTKYEKNILWLLLLATIPGILAGYFLESYAETTFRSPILIAIMLSAAGLILYLADKYRKHRREIREIEWRDSLFIGLSQAVAVIPGVSRSGVTITAGLLQGLSRQSAARFSFLLSTPIIFGAAAKEIPRLVEIGIDIPLLLAVISSFISGYLAIKYLLRFVDRTSYAIFFWYRLALAFIIFSVSFYL